MPAKNPDEVLQHFFELLREMDTQNASDFYYTAGYAPSMRIHDVVEVEKGAVVTDEEIWIVLDKLLNPRQKKEFAEQLELNFPIVLKDGSRFRANVFQQQQKPGMVIRRINVRIPSLDELGLPAIYQDMIMKKQGLIILASPSGSGKSTSMAAMLGHRNQKGRGHILTIEDPIEFLHMDGNCIFTQREVGVDTHSFEAALTNALRQKADVIVVGEVRTREAMTQALRFAEAGHLCITTLHASGAPQAIKRILSFFPEDMRQHTCISLAQNLLAVFSQKLLPDKNGGTSIAIEILKNEGLVRELISEGKVGEIQDAMERTGESGCRSMDQALFDLYYSGKIDLDVALHEANNPSNLRLKVTKTEGLGGIVQKPDEF